MSDIIQISDRRFGSQALLQLCLDCTFKDPSICWGIVTFEFSASLGDCAMDLSLLVERVSQTCSVDGHETLWSLSLFAFEVELSLHSFNSIHT